MAHEQKKLNITISAKCKVYRAVILLTLPWCWNLDHLSVSS